MAPPPPLERASLSGTQTLVYGPGVPAPWNRLQGASAPDQTTTVAEARLHSTWDYDTKDFTQPPTKRWKLATPVIRPKNEVQ